MHRVSHRKQQKSKADITIIKSPKFQCAVKEYINK